MEEFAGEAVFKQIGVTDPENNAKLHLNEKYMREAEELLARKNYA